MIIFLLLISCITLVLPEEYDYCNITCGTADTNSKHIVCQRKNHCDKPANECRGYQNVALSKEERQLILSNHLSPQKPQII